MIRQRRQRRDGMTEGRKGGRMKVRKNRRTEGRKDRRTEGRKDRRTEEPKNTPPTLQERGSCSNAAFPSYKLAPPHRRSSETQTATSSLAGVKPRRLDLWQEQQLAMKWRDDNNEMGQHAAQCARSTNMEAVPIAAAPPLILAP